MCRKCRATNTVGISLPIEQEEQKPVQLHPIAAKALLWTLFEAAPDISWRCARFECASSIMSG
jgi:hypothetical protein